MNLTETVDLIFWIVGAGGIVAALWSLFAIVRPGTKPKDERVFRGERHELRIEGSDVLLHVNLNANADDAEYQRMLARLAEVAQRRTDRGRLLSQLKRELDLMKSHEPELDSAIAQSNKVASGIKS
jgi:hypothetical protein